MSTYLRPLYAARTDPGRQRDHNEDSLHVAMLPVGEDTVSPWYMFTVADGVGGHERGAWASQTAVSVLTGEMARQLVHASPLDALRAAFDTANLAVLQGATPSMRPGRRAATTLVAALVRDGTLWWAHVGDSRLYLVRQGRALRVTEDHSWIEEQLRAGFISREDALRSDRRHAITRSIGFDPSVTVDTGGPIPLRSGDVMILCSDGLHGQVTDEELAGIVQQLLPEAAAERLVALTNERGGPDNISVIICVMFDASAGDTGDRPMPVEADVTLP